MTDAYHHTQPLVEMRSCKLLPGLALNSNPPYLSLPRN
jgi:hypothetical protein